MENGRSKCVIADNEKYEKSKATINQLSKLMKAEKAIKTGEERLTSTERKQHKLKGNHKKSNTKLNRIC